MKELGEKLKEKRKNRHFTQSEISKLLNINRVTYTGYESGIHDPDLKTLIKIADIFDTSIDILVGRYHQ